MALNARQKKFCQEFVKLEIDPTCKSPITQAALNAGYSNKTAAVMGSENLKKPEIAVLVEALRKKKQKNARIPAIDGLITPEFVLKGIAEIATKAEARDGDRIRAYELLGRYLAMFTDKQEVKGDLTGQIVLKFDPKSGLDDGDITG